MKLIDTKIRVLVIGANGQDGRLLINHFRSLEVEILGVVIRPPKTNVAVSFEVSDFSNSDTAFNILNSFKPTHIFHLAAVHGSSSTMQGVEAKSGDLMRQCHVGIVENLISWGKLNNQVHIVVGLSSQMYTPLNEIEIITEISPPTPQNVYGQTKSEGFELLRKARYEFGLHISGAILFNHSSELSKQEFLLPQLAAQLARFQAGNTNEISVRNAGALISIGDAREFCYAMAKMSLAEVAEDYVIAYPSLTSIEQLIIDAAESLALKKPPEIISDFSKKPDRVLLGDINKAKSNLDWQPTVTPAELLASMTKIDMGLNGKK